MKFKEKGWIWKLTKPFAHNNYTVVFGTIYYPKGHFPSKRTIDHEEIHVAQARRCGGWLIFYFAYLFLLPVLWNPFRKRWETEAYIAVGEDPTEVKQVLRSRAYGWLR